MNRAHGKQTEQRIQGLLLAQENHEALVLSRQWLETAPEDPQAWFSNAVCRHVNDDIEGALEAFNQVLERVPGHLQALNGRGGMLARKGDYNAALSVFREAVSLSGDDPDLRLNEALALEALGQFPEALDCYDAIIRHSFDHLAALLNRGLLLIRMQRLDEAVRQGEAVAGQFPNQAMAQVNHAEILLKASRYTQSLEACERVLELDTNNIAARVIMVIALAALGRIREANMALSIVRRDPGAGDACCRNLLGAHSKGLDSLVPGDLWFRSAWQRLRELDWQRYDEDSALARRLFTVGDEGIKALTGVEYYLPLQNFLLDDGIRRRHAMALTRQVQSELQPQIFIARDVNRGTRLRIAYLIADPDENPLLALFLPVFAEHSRQSVLITVYSLSVPGPQGVIEKFRQCSERFVDLSELSAREAAFRIYQDGNDILVELNPYSVRTGPEICAHKPVPVQVWYAGHSGTSGAPWMDYALVDRHSSPLEDRPYWTEQRALLPAPAIALSEEEFLPTATPREVLGLPADAFVFCSFSRPENIEPLVFSAWMRMLLRVPGSILWLQAYSREAIAGLVAEADFRGVTADRLMFMPHQPNRGRYLADLASADLYLDTVLNNGFLRVTDALLAGVVPLVCPGAQICGRRSSALLKELELDTLVCPDLGNYESMAVTLATDREQLEEIRRKLHLGIKCSRLFDAGQQARDLEAAYAQMWAHYCEHKMAEEFVL